MKLQNKKTGKIINSEDLFTDDFIIDLFSKSFSYFDAKVNEIQKEWEDYEEPKEYYWLRSGIGDICETKDTDTENDKFRKSIGNYFSSREEAEQAVEKLEAWKRLKDKGFVFKGINMSDGSIKTGLSKGVSLDDCEGFYSDMELLFGGVE